MRKKILFFFIIIAQMSCSETKQIIAKGSIKNTNQFITYLATVNNYREYQTAKDSIEVLVKSIKSDARLTKQDKEILKVFYTNTQMLSENMYFKIRSDLTSKQSRSVIVSNIPAYVNELNNNLSKVKTSAESFQTKYRELTDDDKGINLAVIIIKSFVIPLAQEFVDEIITTTVTQQLDQHLKPVLVIKPWETI